MRTGDRVEVLLGWANGEEGTIVDDVPLSVGGREYALDLDGGGRMWVREEHVRVLEVQFTESRNHLPPEMAHELLKREAVAACTVPPPGWWCSRDGGHDGPCAARPKAPEGSELALTGVEREAMDLVIEECAESIQCSTKLRRFGARVNPYKPQEHNRDRLESELGDVLAAVAVAQVLGLVDMDRIHAYADAKFRELRVPTGRISEELRAILVADAGNE